MNNQTDSQLLREYAERRDEGAFAELVRRHVDFVYSAAKRMVCDAHLAEDVTQCAFVALAKSAPDLLDHPVLSGWLHRTAHNIAAQTVRTDVRRRAREKEAAEMIETSNDASEASWETIAPHLDEALSQLNNGERDALFLRYFQRQSAPQIAQALGISAEAAQKRVNRAVDHLHVYLSNRKITIGTTGLVALLSVNAVQAAPLGLAAAACAAGVSGTISASALIAATKTITMTTFQKIAVATVLVALTGAGIYEARQNSVLSERLEARSGQQAQLAEQVRSVQQERDELSNRVANLIAENNQLKQNSTDVLKLRAQVARLQSLAHDDTSDQVKALVAQVQRLKQRFENTPGAKIPELQFLTEQDWLKVAGGKLETDTDYRRALSSARSYAENTFGSMLHSALSQYLKDNGDRFPTDLSQLQSYLPPSVDDSILQRWQITSPMTVPNVGVGLSGIITEKAAVDEIFDSRIVVGSSGTGSVDFLTTVTQDALRPVYRAYDAANGGKPITELSQLIPYATTPEQKAALDKVMLRSSLRK